jgi:hypothetical protein
MAIKIIRPDQQVEIADYEDVQLGEGAPFTEWGRQNNLNPNAALLDPEFVVDHVGRTITYTHVHHSHDQDPSDEWPDGPRETRTAPLLVDLPEGWRGEVGR